MFVPRKMEFVEVGICKISVKKVIQIEYEKIYHNTGIGLPAYSSLSAVVYAKKSPH